MTMSYNRYLDTRKDFTKLNEYANEMEPLLVEAEFESEEDKEKVIDWVRETFFNQWKQSGGSQ